MLVPRRLAAAALAAVMVLTVAGCTGDDDGSPSTAPDDGGADVAPGASAPDAAALEVAESEPVEDPYYPEKSHPEVDALHYLLDLDWDGSTLTGAATVTFRVAEATDAVGLDLSDAFEVGTVELDGEDVDVLHAADTLQIQTGPLEVDSVHVLEIEYAGAPESTPAPSQRSDMSEGLGWQYDVDGTIYTFQEPYGAFTWYPVNDHPSDEALYDAEITTYDGDVGVFNGELVSSTTDGDDSTDNVWHLAEPAASYLTTIAIGPYTEHVETTPGGMDISYWLKDTDEGLLPGLAEEGDRAFDWLVEHAGPYPFDTLGVVVVGGSSAMETETMVTMSAGAVDRSDAVLQHEFAHQWYGDSVTPRSWPDVWLNEGFAMYFQQWYEVDTGRPVYGGGLSQWAFYDQLSRKSSGPPGDYDPANFGDSNVYLGPALMLDTIRQRIGDQTFEDLLVAWASDHEGQTVDRETFESWWSEESGRDLGPLIDKWLDSPRTPKYSTG